jgi:iron complex outermembrane receptor protein
MTGLRTLLLASAATAFALADAPGAQAQNQARAAEPAADVSEIVVMARKREESILKVPVVVTALPQQKLERLQTTDIADLPRLVPGLNLGQSVLSIGILVAVRGVGTSAADPGVDQSVSLNIDGLSLGHGLAFQSGMFDLQQIEVLKGPQALFYGKSSPGGVIALRTADPTDKREVIARAGYEFEGREGRGELILSGPLSDGFKARLATMLSKGDGYFYNHARGLPGSGGADASSPGHRETQPKTFATRATLVWDPTATFSARLKANYVYDRLIDSETEQYANCPQPLQTFNMPGFGPAPFLGNENCRMDRELNIAYMDPAFYPGIYNKGVPFLVDRQTYGTLELNYRVRPGLQLTSTTGLYRLRSSSLVNSFHTTNAGVTLAFQNSFRRRELTQEFRLNSDFSGPLNFTAGAFYQDASTFDRVGLIGNKAYPLFAAINRDGSTTIDIKTYSVFGQARYRITDQLELAAGARWTDETRKERLYDYVAKVDYTNTLAAGQTVLPPRRIHASNVSPEVTLTYTPTNDLTLFASYKRGYKSGSFAIATPPAAGGPNAFGDEKVRGGEVGIKARLADHQVLANLAAYDYRYAGLQVGAIEPPPPGGVPIIRVINAGSARTYGVDFDVTYRPAAVEGLSLNAAVNWNQGHYKKLDNIPCYTGQQVAQGCTTFFVPSANQAAPPVGAYLNPATGKYGFFTGQDLSGTRMIRAPEWQATFGFDYEFPVGGGMTMTLTNSNQVLSKYVTFLAVGRPGNDNIEPGFIKSDLSLALKGRDNHWEIALIGKNITDKITSSNCTATNYEGGNVLGAPVTGGTISGPAGYSEKACFTERGRSVWVRATYRPLN